MELGKIKAEIMQLVRAELQATHDREISKFVEMIRSELETFKGELIRDLKNGKPVDAGARPSKEHVDIS